MLRSSRVGDLTSLALGCFGVILGGGGGNERRNDAPAALAGMSQRLRMKCTLHRREAARNTRAAAASATVKPAVVSGLE